MRYFCRIIYLNCYMTRSSHERDMLSIVRMSIVPVRRTGTAGAYRLRPQPESTALQQIFLVLILWTITVVQQMLVGTLAPYYCKYIFGNDSLYSLLYMAENITLIVGALACPQLLSRFSKRDLCLSGCVLAVLAQLLLFIDSRSFTMLFAVSIVRAIGQAPITAVIFGMMGDVVEYGHWKFGVRQESLIFGGGSLGFKIGSGISAAIVTALLGAAGFVSSVNGGNTQPESAKHMIVAIYQFGILAIWIAATLVLLFYKLDKQYPQIMKDLEARAKK